MALALTAQEHPTPTLPLKKGEGVMLAPSLFKGEVGRGDLAKPTLGCLSPFVVSLLPFVVSLSNHVLVEAPE